MRVERDSEISVGIYDVSRAFSDPWRWRVRSRQADKQPLAVSGVDLTLRSGDILGLVGPNGAGKTTLIKMVCSLLYPSSGAIRVHGYDTVANEIMVRNIVGLVTSNERSFYWRLTGQQNLEFFAGLYKLDPACSKMWIEQLLEFLSLTEYRHQRFDSYSTGTRQRFAFARGLLSKPRVLLLDEPTKGVDPVSASQIVSLIREQLLSLWHPTIIITSHNLSEVELICQRIAIMNRGVIVADGTFKELQSRVDVPQQYSFRLQPDSPPVDISHLRLTTKGVLTAEVREHEEGDVITVLLQPGGDFVHGLLCNLIGTGAQIREVSRQDVSLNDVFIHMIDRATTQCVV